ncbi:hypothetical protein ABT369_38945 [Dactylosporangium sp. NPDC000244]|uniref:hypothetical protein n=1 Tax=Dactylosporangium sp. NPDC000244 TaxID=3154365 RepID=UPI003318DD74
MGYRPGDLRPVNGGPFVAVVAPRHCRNGHPLTPYRVHVGYTLCDCGQGGTRGHHTWNCRECGDTTVGDGCTREHEFPPAWPVQRDEIRAYERQQNR